MIWGISHQVENRKRECIYVCGAPDFITRGKEHAFIQIFSKEGLSMTQFLSLAIT